MQLRNLGKTEVRITPLGLGCWQFTQGLALSGLVWPRLDLPTIDSIVKAALDGGINWFDTAEAYGLGRSELALAGALQRAGRKPGDVVIATKWLPLLRTAGSIERTFPTRERKLAPFPIDLLQIHMPSSPSPLEKQAAALARLLKAHRVKAVGVSNFSAGQMRVVHKVLSGEGFTLASNQVLYALNHRKVEWNGVVETAKELGISIIAYSPLGQGILTGRFHDNPDATKALPLGRRLNKGGVGPEVLRATEGVVRALQEIGRAHKASAAQVALNWLVSFHGDTVVAIPGATKVRQVEDFAGALSFSLSDDEKDRLDRESRHLK
jgi:aryl-alcohol dehydrogenase-like predicted oxidoreductase